MFHLQRLDLPRHGICATWGAVKSDREQLAGVALRRGAAPLPPGCTPSFF